MGWGSGNLGGSGGGLNFVVKQYTETPTGTAKENTIGVVTDTAITSWVMQAEQPTSPAAGMVWIKSATTSTVAFYADKKQQVKLYPKSVKQYVSGAWVNCEAFIYQDGAWAQFSSAQLIIYQSGAGLFANFSEGGSGGTRTVEESSGIYLEASVASQKTGSSYCYAYTTDKVDVSGFDNLFFTLKSYKNVWGASNKGSTVIAVSSALPSGTTFTTGEAYARYDGNTELFDVESSVDVSSLSGSYYIVVYAAIGSYNDGNSYVRAKYDNIYLG